MGKRMSTAIRFGSGKPRYFSPSLAVMNPVVSNVDLFDGRKTAATSYTVSSIYMVHE